MNAFPPDRDPDADLRRLAEVYRRCTPPEPSTQQWQRVQHTIAEQTCPRSRSRAWPRSLVVAAVLLVSLIAIGYGVLRTGERAEIPSPVAVLPPEERNDEPFAVASVAEITIHDVEVADADRIAVGRLLLGQLEFARAGDIEVVESRPDPTERWMPTIAPNATMPLIVASGQEP